MNAYWDREIMEAFGAGDVESLCAMSYESIEEGGGHGGHEILNWIALMGAMRGAPAEVIGYEPVMEWICGMGYLAYAGDAQPAPAEQAYAASK